jgi:hypothetical protein
MATIIFAPFRAFTELPTELRLMVWKKVLSVELVINASDSPEEDADPCYPSNLPEAASVVDSDCSNKSEVFQWKPITLDRVRSPADELLETL